MATIKRINATKGYSKIGYLVQQSSSKKDSVAYLPANAQTALGVITNSVAYRKECDVAINGEALVYVVDNVRKGDIIRAQKSADNISGGACRVAKTADVPYLKVGTALESGKGLVRVSIEWANLYSDGTSALVPYVGATQDLDLGTHHLSYTPFPFQASVFANPLNLDGTTYKDFVCASITGDTTINLNNVSDGDAGMIELIIDAVGGYTVSPGAMFTKKLGTNNINTVANKDNFISYRVDGGDIVYTINTVQA